MKNINEIHSFFERENETISSLKPKGWAKTCLLILFVALFSRKNKKLNLNGSNLSIILPLNSTPQIIIPIGKRYHYHLELYRYLGSYSSFFLKVILKTINFFGLPDKIEDVFLIENNDFNFILNTNNKLILFENEYNDSIYLKKYYGDNKTIDNYHTREIYLKGNQFDINLDTKTISNYFLSKNKLKVEEFKKIDLKTLNIANKDIELSINVFESFLCYYEHGDFVLSNVRFLDDDILIYDSEDSISNGFYFTDISTFIFSYFSGEPLMNKVWIVKFMLFYKKKWFLALAKAISKNFDLSLNDVLYLIYVGLIRKVQISTERGESSRRFWFEISEVYFRFLQKNKKNLV